MEVSTLLVLVVAASMVAARAAPPAFPGYVMAAQYHCDDFQCEMWELDMTRVDPLFRRKNLTEVFDTLVPKAPIESMNFPVYTAYHEPTRTYTVLADQKGTQGTFWGLRIDANVTSSQRLYATKFQFPEQYVGVVGLHTMSNGSIIVVFEGGVAALVDPKSGQFSMLINLLPAPKYSDGKVTTTTAYDVANDTLYAFIVDEFGDNYALASYNARTHAFRATPLTLKQHDRLGAETLMHMVYASAQHSLVVFLLGTNLGFDQVLAVDPETALGDFLFYNLLDSNLLGFQCDLATKTCDAMQLSAYDATQDRVYFQATQYQGADDDLGTTVMAFLDLSHKEPFINIALDPFEYGFMDFQWIDVVAE